MSAPANTQPADAQPRGVRDIAVRLAQLPLDQQRIFLRRLVERGVSLARLPIVAFPRPAAPPLSHAQSRLWFLWKLDPQSPAYNLHQAVRLTGRLDFAALRRTFTELVRRHEALRTVFREQNGEPYQCVADPAPVPVRVDDLKGLPSERRRAAADALIEEEASTPFDLAVGPLLRVRLLRLGNEQHLLLVTMHHIVSDGWSMDIAFREFASLYAAYSRGDLPSLPDLPIQYVDHAVWQRRLTEAGEDDRQLAYWTDRLAGEVPALELPTDFPRPAMQSGHGASVTCHLDASLTEMLKQQAAAHGASLFMLLLAAFKSLLFRYSDQADLRVGVPIAGRNRPETEALIGFFVNTQVLRTEVHGRRRFDEFLAEIRRTALEAQAHQDLPFERLVEALHPERSLSSTPLFQVMYNHLRDDPNTSAALPGLQLEAVERELRAVSFDLALDTAETVAGQLYVSFAYATDLFRRGTIERMRDHFTALLRRIARAPDTRIADLPLLTPAEWQQFETWNPAADEITENTLHEHRACFETRSGSSRIAPQREGYPFDGIEKESHPEEAAERPSRRTHGQLSSSLSHYCPAAEPYPPTPFVHHTITRQAAPRWHEPAVLCGGDVLTHGELESRANRLAHHLAARGVRPDVLVGVALERSVALLVSLLAVLKAGGAYVPLDPDYPEERLRTMMEDAGVGLLLTHSSLHDRLPIAEGLTCLDIDRLDLGAEPDEPPDPPLHPDNLAYLIYTSGSTGRPKGVAVSHGPLAMHCRAIGARYEMSPRDRELIFMSFSFDGAHERWLTVLTYGGSVVIRDPELWTPDQTLAALHRHDVTVTALPPAHLQQLAELAEQTGDPPPVRVYCFAGDAVPQASFDLVQRTLRPQYIVNGYGPTETVVTPLLWKAGRDAQCEAAYAPIGDRVGARSAWVLDADLNPVPVGIAGELYLGGLGVARGYHNQPGLTAERFVPDPFSEDGGRLYRSGDRVRQRTDGTIDYLGRVDHQVKIRGFRIETGEIEARLVAHPDVREALVVARDTPSGKQLIAYVAGDEPELPTSLKTYLKGQVPDYMVPAQIVVLQRLPVNANGKLDRNALPEPEWRGNDDVAPRTEMERVLATIWQEVLGVSHVGATDNFFELGGHSLLAIRVVSRVQTGLGRPVELRALFEAPTLEEFAAAVDRHAPASDTLPPLTRLPYPEAVPLSFAQSRLWFLWQLEPDSAAYNIPLALRLLGDVQTELLERAFTSLIARHEALRTSFTQRDGQVVQDIRAPQDFLLIREDLSDRSYVEQECQVRQRAEQAAATPFDLAADTLLRARLLRLDAREHVLLATIHHIVADGWSMAVLVDELCALYAALARGEPAALPELPIQYADYALWQRDWLAGGEGERQLAYWTARLGNVQAVLNLPSDHPRRAVQSHRGANHDVTVIPALAAGLRALAQTRRVTPFMLLLAAFKVLLYRYSGETDLRIGVPIANRNRPEVEGLIGFFVNTQVLRTEVDGGRGFLALLDQVRDVALAAQAHQDLPFEQLVEALQPERSLSHNPLFQVMFSHERQLLGVRQPAGLDVEIMDFGTSVAQFDLSLHTEERADGGIACTFNYATDLFEADTIARLGDHFLHLLSAIADLPQLPLDRLPLIGPSERSRLIRTGDAEVAEVTPGAIRCLHHRFEEQAARRPDAVAVSLDDRALTYGELNKRANQLARHLRTRGVGPDTLVGLAVERSPEMLVGIYGILKAGGAYVPLDPSYPPERLAFMQADSGITLLLTQQHLLDTLPKSEGRYWCLDRDWHEIADYPDDDLPSVVRPENLAYCIYTSGSTGTPKGALLSHANVDRLLTTTEADFAFSPSDVWTLFHSFAFDFSVWEIFGALSYGGRLVVVPYDVTRSPEDFHDLLLRERVTILNQTPSAFQPLARVALERDVDLTLRCVVFGGEALDVRSLLPWFDRFGDTRPLLVNMYGITETTVHVSYRPLRREDALANAGSPIGRSLGDLSWYVLDRNMEPAPVGVFGEIHVAGPGLARGYHHRAGLTAERFVPSPFGALGERLYRTGDLARWRADGSLDYVGRIDHQVKLRGFRIELGEIEARLRDDPVVRDAAVLVRDTAAGKQLIGYVAAATTDGLGERLKADLRSKLPDYMVPAHIIALPALPLTANGKLDRGALPEPDWQAAAYEPPTGDIECLLVDIWQDVLELPRIGATGNFFELGGDSIVSIQMVSRARERGLAVSPKDLFQHQTVRALAAVVRQTEPAVPTAPVALPSIDLAVLKDRLPVAPEEIADIYPLSPMQQGMLFHTADGSADGGASDLYINQVNVGVHGLDADRFRTAWQAAVAHHEILRTGFIWEGVAEPVQFVLPAAELPIRQVDWRGRDVTPQMLAEAADAERATGFDLAYPPLMRVLLLRLGEDDWRLIWTYHHALIDGWSTSRLIGDVLRHYRGEALEPSGRYRDYIGWLRAQDAGAAESFWRRRLAALDEPTLLSGAVPPGPRGEGHQAVYTHLDKSHTERLVIFAQQQRITLNTLIQGAWLLLLRRYTGQRTVVFGATVSGRPAHLPGAENMLGVFINTLPVIQTLPPEQTVGDWLRAVQAENLEIRDWEHTPLHDIQRWAGRTGQALFDSIIVFENQPIDRTLRNWEDRSLRFDGAADVGVTNFPMDLMVTLEEDGLEIEYMFMRDRFDEVTVACLRRHMEGLLDQLAQDPARRLGQIGLADPDDRARLERLNAPTSGYPGGTPVHHLIAAQAEHQPDAPALLAGDAVMSYGELDARANRLAWHLIERGVGPEAIVGVAMRRSPDLVVAFLAILKAGAAYVPLDPDYPDERLRYMIEDAGLGLLLTEAAVRQLLPLPQGTAVLEVDRLDLSVGSARAPASTLHPDNLAYLIYTSGSTGQPKGVAVSHGPLAMHSRAIGERYAMTASDRELHFMSFSFDGAHERWLTVLTHGGSLVIRDDALWTPEQTFNALHRYGVTVAAFPPAYLQQLAEHAERVGDPPPVRIYCFGGDAVPNASFEQAKRALRPQHIINGYGPTETVVTPMLWKAAPEDRCGAAYAPIGDRVGARTTWVLDVDLNPLPPGVAGELYLGGEGVARGYHHRPGFTAERFVPDPFSTDGGRMYRTGDLVRQRPDGLIDYLGRIDHQVKIRGFRIELGEIEARLSEHRGVREALVVARETPSGKQLVGYVAGDGAALADLLKARLKAQLPDYMVPAQIVVLDRLPVNANGKLDRDALPDPEWRRHDHVAPRTALERALADIWQQVLGVERIGVTDNFFELGGDSMQTLRVIARVRGRPELGLDLRLRDLMQKPTIAQLCGGDPPLQPAAEPDPFVLLNRALPGRKPLFCLHAGFGTVFDYDSLARRLDGVVPVQGLQCRMLLDPAWDDSSIAAMAQDYTRYIRDAQPRGPYRLLGWSLGGSLAVLIARALEEQGQALDFIGLVDPFVPGEPGNAVSWRDELAAFLQFTLPDAAEPDDVLLSRLEADGGIAAMTALIDRHMATAGQSPPTGYASLRADELALVLHTARRLRSLSAEMAPLPPIAIDPHCWWLPSRSAARHLFREQTGRTGITRELDSTHFRILHEPEFLDDVEAVLATSLEPV